MNYDEWKTQGPDNYWVWDRTWSDDPDEPDEPEAPECTTVKYPLRPSVRYLPRVTDPQAETDAYLNQDYDEYLAWLATAAAAQP